MMERAFRMFSVFPGQEGAGSTESAPAATPPAKSGGDLDDLRREMAEMRARIDKMGTAKG